MIKLCRDSYLIWPMEAVVGPNSYPINPTVSHLGLHFSIENEIFKPRMKISSEHENFVRGGMVFVMRSSENEFFRSPGPLGWATLKFYLVNFSFARFDG